MGFSAKWGFSSRKGFNPGDCRDVGAKMRETCLPSASRGQYGQEHEVLRPFGKGFIGFFEKTFNSQLYTHHSSLAFRSLRLRMSFLRG